MAESTERRRLVLAGALVPLVAFALFSAGVAPAGADVTAVKGSAYGFFSDVGLFGGPKNTRGPAPEVTLATDATNSPEDASVATSQVQYGPAILFSTDQITVHTEGSLGAGGSVTSTATLNNINRSQQEVFTAASASSTCTASETATSASTTINNGRLQTSEGDPNVDGDEVFVDIPTNPDPNTRHPGTIEAVGDNFEYIFNEQILNPDGSITVYAGHLRLLGPTAVGDLYWGKVECGVTPPGPPPTTSTSTSSTSSSTVPGSSTTSTTRATTSTTRATTSTTRATTSTTRATTSTTRATTTSTSTTTTTPEPPPEDTTTTTEPIVTTVTDVSGSAYGFFVSISLFGGPAATRGPTPEVTLPAGGSAEPITASEATGEAIFGPAQIFTSDALDVSTQGTPGAGGSVTSTASINNVNRGGEEVFTAATLNSDCTATETGATGSTTLTGGKLITSEVNPDIDEDDIIETLPDDPAPNTTYDGKLEAVGDTFQVILNEQIVEGSSITVNAMHMKLLGPTAVGDLFVGQVKCSLSATTTGGGDGSGGDGTGGFGSGDGTGGTGGRSLAGTGNESVLVSLLAMDLVLVGVMATRRRLRARGAPPGFLR